MSGAKTRVVFHAMVGFGLIVGQAAAQAQPEKKPEAKPPATQPSKPEPRPVPATKPAAAEVKRPPASGEDADMESMMKAMMPGPVHEQMAKRVGEYITRTKMWMAPGAEPEETPGTAKFTSIMEGRFLSEEITGTMMETPFRGMRLWGYNNGSKKYESVWIYTMGTGMLTLSGTSDDGGKTIRYTGEFVNEIGTRETLEVITRQTDDDHFDLELSGKLPDGGSGPRLVTTFSRKKQP